MALAMMAPAQAGQREAAAKVHAGIERFAAGDFKAASEAFSEADAAKPDDAWIAYDRAAAQAAQGEVDKAAELLRKASLSRDAGLAARAHYNLGCLAAGRARALFGERPQDASAEVRQKGLGLLTEAVAHYRDCLRVDAQHADARYNLESIRLWIKHMQAAWEEHDRQKQRKETGLLEFLEMLQTRQRLLRATCRLLVSEPDSPRRRQAVVTAATEQRSLGEEIGPLKDKIRDELVKAAQASAPQANASAPGAATSPGAQAPASKLSPEAQRAIEVLSVMADQAGQSMRDAADRLNDGALADAVKPQEKAVEQLDRLQVSLLPFPSLLQKAIGRQQELIDLVKPDTPPSSPASNAASPATTEKKKEEAKGEQKQPKATETAKKEETGKKEKTETKEPASAATRPVKPTGQPARVDQVDFADAAWEQGFLPGWSDALAVKASHGLKDLEAAGAPTPEASPGPPATAGGATSSAGKGATGAPPQADAEKAQKQREAMKRTFDKAIELCPRVHALTAEAAAALKERQPSVAIPKQEQALKLLREIAEQMPKEEQKDQKKDEKQDQKQDQKQDKQSSKQDSQKQKPEERQQERQKNASRDQAEATLRKARQRERERQNLDKQLRQWLYRPGPVEKDW